MAAFGLTLGGLLVASVTLAQPKHDGRRGDREFRDGQGHMDKAKRKQMRKEKRKAMHKRFKKMMSKALREDVGLDEQTARTVEKVHERQHSKRKALHKKMHQSKRALRALIQSDSNDQKAYSVAVDGLLKTRAALQRLREQDFAKVRRLLTPKQQGRLLFTMHKKKRQMHRHMGRRGGKHKARQGRPHGPPSGADGEFDG